MRVDLFDFDLPPDRIALRPAVPREAARLMEVTPDGVSDHVVGDLAALLRAGDVMVVNDTKVIPARLHGRRGEAKVEATLHQRLGPDRWAAFARPAKRLRAGDRIEFGKGLAATVAERREAGEVVLDFETAGGELLVRLDELGEMPLPPYIAAKRAVDARDREDYQTVMATEPGAVAAPTAGLHLTEALLERLEAAGVAVVRITLHVGAGTFLPVKADDTEDHRMHAEHGTIAADAAHRINAAREAGGRLVAVGTTSLRLLESASDEAGRVQPFDGSTDIFITPGHRFRSADLLMTNFHLPRSTLFMLVAAFSGLERMRAAYTRAIRTGYRFYSYGDAMLLHRMAP